MIVAQAFSLRLQPERLHHKHKSTYETVILPRRLPRIPFRPADDFADLVLHLVDALTHLHSLQIILHIPRTP
ncbi:MAG: hypothetical protein JWP03_3649, partial [Phycisphaerales bacterium]|nr:hypothetical protein [Phycisphaerales bacterium]